MSNETRCADTIAEETPEPEITEDTHAESTAQKLISKGKVVGTLTTLGISGIALLSAATFAFSADLWLPRSSQYAINSDFQREVTNLATLPEHSYLLGCNVGFPTEAKTEATTGKVFLNTTEGTTVTAVKTLGENGKTPLSQPTRGQKVIDANQPTLVSVSTTGKSSFAGTTFTAASNATLKGITTANCSTAQIHSWFATGNTGVGESTYLTVTNPSGNATQITLEAWNGTGKFSHGPSLTIPANTTETFNVASFFPDEDRLGLHASVHGPGVVVTLHSAGEKGLASRGLETVAPVVAPSKENIFPSVVASSNGTKIQILNPRNEVATAKILVADPLGTKPLPGAENIEIAGSAVFELDLAGIGEGSKTLILQSDKPLVANITSIFEGGDKEDDNVLADRTIWSATAALTSLKTPLPALQNGEKERLLALYNPSDVAVKVTVNGVEVQVPHNSELTHAVNSDKLEINSTQPIYAGMVIKKLEGKTTLVTRLQFVSPEAALPSLKLNLAD
ncbi:DUF5719 family protein [Gleimia coleocanis]|nr:DUF5719 family protein [Gleimia coleocanis]